MSGDRHEEIAARLREEGAARAPERLRAEVMQAVRAQPRPRRVRRRRPLRWPLGSLAAAACILAALVFGISHLNGTGAGSSSVGATSAAADGAAELRALSAGRDGLSRVPAPAHLHAALPGAADRSLRFRQAVSQAPRPLRYAYLARARLAAPLPKALGTLEPRLGRGSHGR